MSLSSKISPEDMEDFNIDFGYEIRLEGVSFEKNGDESKFKYYTNNRKLVEFKNQISKWLVDHSFPAIFFISGEKLSLYTSEKLSDKNIHDFEKDFKVNCIRYSISCDSNNFKYEFSDLMVEDL